MHEILHTLTIGDRLVRDKGILTKHHGVYVGRDVYGQHLVAENNTPYGVRYVTYTDFLAGNALVRVERMNYTYQHQQQVLENIKRRLGTRYDLFSYNCETFSNEVTTGVAYSPQVQRGVLATLFIGFIAFLSSANNR